MSQETKLNLVRSNFTKKGHEVIPKNLRASGTMFHRGSRLFIYVRNGRPYSFNLVASFYTKT